jgi:hypothetical protein
MAATRRGRANVSLCRTTPWTRKREEAVHARLEDDPWTPMGLLRIAKIEPWQILLGEPNAAA